MGEKMIESPEVSVAREKRRESESGMDRPDRFEGASDRVKGIGKEFECDMEQDKAVLDAMARSLGVSSEEVRSVMVECGKGQDRLMKRENEMRVGVLEKIRRAAEDTKLGVTLAAFLSASEIAGCASGGLFEKVSEARTERVVAPEEKRFFAQAVHEAKTQDFERSYVYGLKKDGNVVFSGEPCAIGGRFGIQGGTDECADFAKSLSDDVNIDKMVHMHTHPLESTADADRVSVFARNRMEREDIEKIKQGDGVGGAFPPSMKDVLGLGISADGLRKDDNKDLELRVADASGVWTYGIDASHPIIRSIIEDRVVFAEESEAMLAAAHVSDEERAEMLESMRKPGATISNEKVRNVLAELSKSEGERAKKMVTEEIIDFLREYEEKQFELASRRFESKEDMMEAAEDFIEYAESHGVFLRYDPAE